MNVLVVVVDALRHDALSMHDADGAPTALTRRIGDWIQLHGCRVAAPWTYPSSTSLLTGIDAVHHQRTLDRQPLHYEGLVGRIGTDYKAAVINNSVLHRLAGIAQQFDEYVYVSDPHGTFMTARGVIAERRLDARSYFLLVHTNIVHDYYLPFARAQYERYFPGRSDYFDIRYRVLAWKDVLEKQDVMRRIYDACVLRVHDEIEGLLSSIPLDDTIVVITADHGEGFDPTRARIHHGGRVHDDLVRIPCAIHLPDSVPPEVRAQLAAATCASTGAVDIVPTLIELTGGEVPSGLDGRSLVAAHGDERRIVRIEDTRYLYLASRLRLNTNAKGKNMTRRNRAFNRLWRATVARRHSVRGFVDGSHKLVVTTMEAPNRVAPQIASRFLARAHNGAPAPYVRGNTWYGLELFDLEHDPGEEHNLLLGPRQGARAARALAIADAYLAGDSSPRLCDLADATAAARR